ncbi:serine hydroxymethyltransferase [Candidatus Uhrbacteria bacterium]|nr:serine hydroxymethyltransferase [Candidatus Uhrbacteria bacterium]
MMYLSQTDPELAQLIQRELVREQEGLELIPSENIVSRAVLEALGSVGTNKYSEGYPGKRYYGGCEAVDAVENLARDRAKALFGVTHANVQPHSGSPANQAVCFALLNPGDTLMGMHLYAGGHMTHGLELNFSGTYYHSVQYTARQDGYIDINEMRALAQEHKPKLIIVGGTAYPRIYEWTLYKEIADEVGAYLLADISHVAGLIVGGQHPTPVGIADVITTTTHKTLRGPRGAMILCNGEESDYLKPPPEKSRKYLPTMIDRAIIPGLQGGPHNHQTAAIAVALHEAAQPEFKEYAEQIVINAKALADSLLQYDFHLVTGGTDNHLLLVDLTNKGIPGKVAEKALVDAGLTVNKNTVPHDPRKPYDPSGIRLGTPTLTTRGMKKEEMKKVGQYINRVLSAPDDARVIETVRQEVKDLCAQFPIYPDLSYL